MVVPSLQNYSIERLNKEIAQNQQLISELRGRAGQAKRIEGASKGIQLLQLELTSRQIQQQADEGIISQAQASGLIQARASSTQASTKQAPLSPYERAFGPASLTRQAILAKPTALQQLGGAPSQIQFQTIPREVTYKVGERFGEPVLVTRREQATQALLPFGKLQFGIPASLAFSQKAQLEGIPTITDTRGITLTEQGELRARPTTRFESQTEKQLREQVPMANRAVFEADITKEPRIPARVLTETEQRALFAPAFQTKASILSPLLQRRVEELSQPETQRPSPFIEPTPEVGLSFDFQRQILASLPRLVEQTAQEQGITPLTKFTRKTDCFNAKEVGGEIRSISEEVNKAVDFEKLLAKAGIKTSIPSKAISFEEVKLVPLVKKITRPEETRQKLLKDIEQTEKLSPALAKIERAFADIEFGAREYASRPSNIALTALTGGAFGLAEKGALAGLTIFKGATQAEKAISNINKILLGATAGLEGLRIATSKKPFEEVGALPFKLIAFGAGAQATKTLLTRQPSRVQVGETLILEKQTIPTSEGLVQVRGTAITPAKITRVSPIEKMLTDLRFKLEVGKTEEFKIVRQFKGEIKIAREEKVDLYGGGKIVSENLRIAKVSAEIFSQNLKGELAKFAEQLAVITSSGPSGAKALGQLRIRRVRKGKLTQSIFEQIADIQPSEIGGVRVVTGTARLPAIKGKVRREQPFFEIGAVEKFKPPSRQKITDIFETNIRELADNLDASLRTLTLKETPPRKPSKKTVEELLSILPQERVFFRARKREITARQLEKRFKGAVVKLPSKGAFKDALTRAWGKKGQFILGQPSRISTGISPRPAIEPESLKVSIDRALSPFRTFQVPKQALSLAFERDVSFTTLAPTQIERIAPSRLAELPRLQTRTLQDVGTQTGNAIATIVQGLEKTLTGTKPIEIGRASCRERV